MPRVAPPLTVGLGEPAECVWIAGVGAVGPGSRGDAALVLCVRVQAGQGHRVLRLGLVGREVRQHLEHTLLREWSGSTHASTLPCIPDTVSGVFSLIMLDI